MTARRRILYVNHEVQCGGAEHSLLELIQGIDKDAYELHLACSTTGPLSERAASLGAQVHLVPMLFAGKLRKLFGILAAAMKLRRLIPRLGIDLVHSNSLIAGYCGVLAARLSRIPMIWHVRDLTYPGPARRMCAEASKVIANSKATARSLRFPEGQQDRIQVVYNGVAERFFAQGKADRKTRVERVELCHELQLPASDRLVGMFGRLDPLKGHQEFIDAARLVLRERHETSFLIVGDVLLHGHKQRLRNYAMELEDYLRQQGIFGKVHLLGHREDIPRLMSAMDVIVQPTREHESFGRSISEAHAVGRPVVASDLGGIPEIVEDDINGYLFEPGDSEALAARILDLLEDPEKARRLGQAGRRMARERFSQAGYVSGIESIYRQLTEPRAGTGAENC